MRPLGWKLDPAWREWYAKVELERAQRQIAWARMEAALEMDRLWTDRQRPDAAEQREFERTRPQ
jgi:hypothetical protein